MKNLSILFLSILTVFGLSNCTHSAPSKGGPSSASEAALGGGQSAVQDDVSQKDIVKVAAGSPDHTTLVTAVKAADLVNALTNAGPFTVFAPTNAAFDKLPAGTVEGLLKPDKKDALSNILEYHVALAVFKPDMLEDGKVLSMASGGSVTIGNKDGKITVNGANVIATIPASNGIIHVIDAVLLPK